MALMQEIDRIYMDYPFYGVRQMSRHLNKHMGYSVNPKHIRRLMRLMGIIAIYQTPKTTVRNKEDKRYPYLLRNLTIENSNQVWCSDITYIPINKGFIYLVVIMDWHSRKVLTWRTSNTLDTDFCVAALEKALLKYGAPEIFNTDQGASLLNNVANLRVYVVKDK